MSRTLSSMADARAYFDALPEQLDTYFDEAYQQAFQKVMDAFEEFFKLTASIDIKAKNSQVITADEATHIGSHGLTLLLKMVDLMQKLDLKHKRQEIEQISIVFATWIMQYDGKINFLEPIVNAFLHAGNILKSKESLSALSEIMGEVMMSCSDEIKQDFDSAELYRPWRLLIINRAIVATRAHNTDLMECAFDDLVRYLPHDATGFFAEGVSESGDNKYPDSVKALILKYHHGLQKVRLH